MDKFIIGLVFLIFLIFSLLEIFETNNNFVLGFRIFNVVTIFTGIAFIYESMKYEAIPIENVKKLAKKIVKTNQDFLVVPLDTESDSEVGEEDTL